MKKFLLLNLHIIVAYSMCFGQVMPITTHSKNATENFIKGRDIFHLTWFEEAPENLQKSIKYDSTLAIAHAYLAMAEYFKFFDPSKSIERARRHAKMASQGERWLVEGWANFIHGEYVQTTKYMDSILSKYPKDNFAAHILGFSSLDSGDPEKAIKVLSKITIGDHPFGPGFNHLAYAYHEVGKNDSALKIVDKFISFSPGNPSAYDSKGHILYDLEKYNEAIAYFHRAALLDNRFAYTQRFLGETLMMLKEPVPAFAAYAKAVNMANDYHPSFKLGLYRRMAEARVLEGKESTVLNAYNRYYEESKNQGDERGEQEALESLIEYFLMTENAEKVDVYLSISKKDITDAEKGDYFKAYAGVLNDNTQLAYAYLQDESASEDHKQLIKGLLMEFKDEIENAIDYYTTLENPSLYELSRLYHLEVKAGNVASANSTLHRINQYKGPPNFDYAIAWSKLSINR